MVSTRTLGLRGPGGAWKSSAPSFRNWVWLSYVLAPGLGFLVCRLGQWQSFLWVDVGIRRDPPTVEGAHHRATSKAHLCRRRAPRRLTPRPLAGYLHCGPRGARPLAAHGDFRHPSYGVLWNCSSCLLSPLAPSSLTLMSWHVPVLLLLLPLIFCCSRLSHLTQLSSLNPRLSQAHCLIWPTCLSWPACCTWPSSPVKRPGWAQYMAIMEMAGIWCVDGA